MNFPFRIFLIALVLRLIPVIALRQMGIGLDDMFQYDMLARSIVAGDGYRWYAQDDLYLVQRYFEVDMAGVDYDPRGVLTSFRPPLYPAFLALIYFLTGVDDNRFFTARLVQAFVGAALAPLTYALARRFFPGNEEASKIAAWVVAAYPLLVLYPLSLATENLFFLLVLSATLMLLIAAETRRTIHFVIAGFLLGLMALTRSVSLAFGGLAVLWTWFALKDRQKAVLIFGMVSLVALPWMVRNSLLHGRPTGVESALGYDLYVGYHPESTGTFQYGISLDLMTMLDDGLRDEIGQEKAIGFIKADPGRIPYLVVRRAGYFFGLERRALTYFYTNDYFGYIPTPLLLTIAAIVLLPFMLVSTSAAFGLTLTRWMAETRLLGLFIFGYVTPHLLILGEDRFHLTLVPFFSILAAHSWMSGLPAVKARWSTPGGRLALALAGIAVCLLLTNWGLELYRDADKLQLLLGPNGNQSYFSY
jgi:hypothetical protein